jgi:hypothetical protein
MQSLLVKQDGNAETRALRVALNGVHQFDGLPHVPIRSCERAAGLLQVARPGKLADAVRVQASRRRRIESSGRIEQLVLLLPDRRDLHDFLILRHAREQVLHALFDRRLGVAIDRTVLREGRHRCEQCDGQQAHAARVRAGQVLHRVFPLPRRQQIHSL